MGVVGVVNLHAWKGALSARAVSSTTPTSSSNYLVLVFYGERSTNQIYHDIISLSKDLTHRVCVCVAL